MRRAEGDPETVGERGLKDVSHSNAAIVYQEPRTLFPVCTEAFWVKLIKFSVCSLLVSSQEKIRALYLASQFGPAGGVPVNKKQ